MTGLRMMEAALLGAIAAIHSKVDQASRENDIWIYRDLCPVVDEFGMTTGYEDHGDEVWITFSLSPEFGFTHRLRIGFHECGTEYDHFLIDLNLEVPLILIRSDSEIDLIHDIGTVIHAMAMVDQEGNQEMEKRRQAEAEAAERATKRARFKVVGGSDDRT